MGVYQKYRGNPEQKLFFLLENFLGGINTEFSDDNSNDVDFDSIINFEMDKVGTLTKRGGFGELNAISQIFAKIPTTTGYPLFENNLPWVENRTTTNPSPELDNDNIVYAKLLQNDNGCFRALAGFSGEKAYRKYQELYGFQHNRFKLLILTTKYNKFVELSTMSSDASYIGKIVKYIGETTASYTHNNFYKGVANSTGTVTIWVAFGDSDTVEETSSEDIVSSTAFYYDVYLPELEYDSEGDITSTETIQITYTHTKLPIQFSWDRNLMNIDTIEFYDKIHFTGNNKCLVTFDRSVAITNATTLASAFTYSGNSFTNQQLSNSAHIPSGLEIRHIGFNVLCNNPMTAINTTGISNKTIQGLFVCTTDNIPLLSLPLGQSFMLNIIYTAESGFTPNFNIEMKEGDNVVTFTKTLNNTYTRDGLKVYDVQFQDVPNGEVEIKITMTDSSDQPVSGLEPYYDYYDIAQLDKEAKPVTQLNIGDYGICEMYNRAVYYKKDTIWFSDINNFGYVPNYNYVTLPIEPTDAITKICYFKKGYIVFTKQRIYKMVSSFGTSDFAVQPVNMSIGCHAGNTVVPIDDTLYFASNRGLYSLRSSTFVEGFENVKELDTKIKTLTNNFTKFNDDLAQPSIRFNGINERAYATRYKDKYLLFYNNYGDRGDYAAENDLDTLVYQFDIGSYTTYRFKEKPTFLFMVDNAIETFSTVEKEKTYNVEEPILEYDFTTASGNTVTDLSGNGRDGIIKGGYGIIDKKGITLNGENSYITGDIRNVNLTDGFSIKLDIDNKEETEGIYPIIPVFHFENYKYSFPDFSQTARASATIGVTGVYQYRLDADITYNYTQISNNVARITPSVTLIANNVLMKLGTISCSITGLNKTYVNVVGQSVQLDDNFRTTIELPSFLLNIDNQSYADETLTLNLDYVVASIGTFGIMSVNNYDNVISLTNLAYGGTPENLPYYEFYTYFDQVYGKLYTTIMATNNATNDDYNVNVEYYLSGEHVYDFSKRQTIEVKCMKEGDYLKVVSFVNGEKIEELGHIPNTILKNLPTKANNRLETLRSVDYQPYAYFKGDLYYIEMMLNNRILKYDLVDGEGTIAMDRDNYYPLTLNNCVWIEPESGLILDGENIYLQIPSLDQSIKFEQGFAIEFKGSFPNDISAKVFDIATMYDNDKSENKNASINVFIDNGTIGIETNALNFKSFRTIPLPYVAEFLNYTYRFECRYLGDKIYEISVYIDDTLIDSFRFIGGVSNAFRTSNFIGKSNTTTDKFLKGILENFKLSVFTSTEATTYRNCLFEFDISPTDFGKDIYVEVITKGINMKFPQHMKKLKHIFVKAIGGNKYGEFFFELYADGHRVNDPRKFYVYLDENGTLVYDYTGERIFTLEEINSVLGSIRLDHTALGEGKYQTKKLVIPKKAKNFSCRIYGNTDDYISLESIGFVCKLGKVKES